jgi:hypothetical protein
MQLNLGSSCRFSQTSEQGAFEYFWFGLVGKANKQFIQRRDSPRVEKQYVQCILVGVFSGFLWLY